ncbi:hypothetical protein HK100_002302, partial [Physocladia obscura]
MNKETDIAQLSAATTLTEGESTGDRSGRDSDGGGGGGITVDTELEALVEKKLQQTGFVAHDLNSETWTGGEQIGGEDTAVEGSLLINTAETNIQTSQPTNNEDITDFIPPEIILEYNGQDYAFFPQFKATANSPSAAIVAQYPQPPKSPSRLQTSSLTSQIQQYTSQEQQQQQHQQQQLFSTLYPVFSGTLSDQFTVFESELTILIQELKFAFDLATAGISASSEAMPAEFQSGLEDSGKSMDRTDDDDFNRDVEGMTGQNNAEREAKLAKNTASEEEFLQLDIPQLKLLIDETSPHIHEFSLSRLYTLYKAMCYSGDANLSPSQEFKPFIPFQPLRLIMHVRRDNTVLRLQELTTILGSVDPTNEWNIATTSFEPNDIDIESPLNDEQINSQEFYYEGEQEEEGAGFSIQAGEDFTEAFAEGDEFHGDGVLLDGSDGAILDDETFQDETIVVNEPNAKAFVTANSATAIGDAIDSANFANADITNNADILITNYTEFTDADPTNIYSELNDSEVIGDDNVAVGGDESVSDYYEYDPNNTDTSQYAVIPEEGGEATGTATPEYDSTLADFETPILPDVKSVAANKSKEIVSGSVEEFVIAEKSAIMDETAVAISDEFAVAHENTIADESALASEIITANEVDIADKTIAVDEGFNRSYGIDAGNDGEIDGGVLLTDYDRREKRKADESNGLADNEYENGSYLLSGDEAEANVFYGVD